MAVNLISNWQQLQSTQDRITALIEQELESKHGVSVREYTLLSLLSTQFDGKGGHFQMKQLAERVGLSQSATTRLVSRLEGRNFLTRYICEGDRRGIYTDVTEESKKLLAEIEPTVQQALEDALQKYQDDEQFSRYLEALTK